MDKFTKLNLNGSEKFVSAIYDGSGNDIAATYETKLDATSKESTLNSLITTANQAITALTDRVVITEGFQTTINNNATNIQANTEAIEALKTEDTNLQNSINTLTIGVAENKTNLTTATSNIGTLSSSVLSLNGKVSTLEAVVNDETSGINALNNQADKNSTDIATINGEVTSIKNTLSNQNTSINNINSSIETMTTSIEEKVAQSEYNTKIGELETAIGKKVEQETFDTVNTQVETNTETIDAINTSITSLNESVASKVSQTDYEALLARVVALEALVAQYHPDENTGEEETV